jgi:hypothetical protein
VLLEYFREHAEERRIIVDHDNIVPVIRHCWSPYIALM